MKRTELAVWLFLLIGIVFLFSCAAPPPVPPPPVPAYVPPPPEPPPVEPPPVETGCKACHAGKGDDPLAADVYEHWETSGHGRYAERRKYASDCEACHDVEGAPGHLDGEKNAPGANTFHLVDGYLTPSPAQEWDFQVAFDDYCWTACHKPLGINDMRHESDGDPTAGAVQMGTYVTYEKALKGYPMDGDLALFPNSDEPPYFAPCVSCHNPHGSGATSTKAGSNRMVRENFKAPSVLCARCHR